MIYILTNYNKLSHQISVWIVIFSFAQVLGISAWAANTDIVATTGSAVAGATNTKINALDSDSAIGWTPENFNITGGNQKGGNLFHSFDKFDLGTYHTANWNLNNPTTPVDNVINRVIGGTSSTIDGTIKMSNHNNSNPNFFFINPAGVTFTDNAKIDLPGSFYVSTAKELYSGTTLVMSADSMNLSTFNVAPPNSFGFLETQTVASANNFNENKVSFTDFNNVSGTKMILNNNGGGTGDLFIATGSLLMEYSYINANNVSIYANGSSNAVISEFNGLNTNLSIPTVTDSIIQISGSKIESTSNTNANSIKLIANKINLEKYFTFITSNIHNENGGSISLDAYDILLNYQSAIYTTSLNYDSGDIKINVKNLTLEENSEISSETGRGYRSTYPNNYSTYNAGNININSVSNNMGSVTLKDSSKIKSNTSNSGDAGSVNIGQTKHFDSVIVFGYSSSIQSTSKYNTTIGDAGDAGSISIKSNSVLVNNNGGIEAYTSAGNKVQTNAGNAGNITIEAKDISVSNSIYGIRSSSNYAKGAGGDAGTVLLTNINGNSNATTGRVSNIGSRVKVDDSTISSYGKNWGAKAGRVIIEEFEQVLVTDNGNINSKTFENSISGCGNNASCSKAGEAGTVILRRIDNLIVKDDGNISSSTNGNAIGAAGKVVIGADNVYLGYEINGITLANSGGTIESKADGGTTDSQGVNGSIDIIGRDSNINDAGDTTSIEVVNEIKLTESSSININSEVQGITNQNNGSLLIRAKKLALENNSKITASTKDNVDSGGIKIISDSSSDSILDMKSGSIISTNSNGSGKVGELFIGSGDISIFNNSEVFNKVVIENSLVESVIENNSTGNANSLLVYANTIDVKSGGEITTDNNSVIPTTNIDSAIINIRTDSLNISNGVISANTINNTNAGDITITGITNNSVNTVTLDKGEISATTSGNGDAGNININATGIDINNKSRIITSAKASSGGKAGNINIRANNLSMQYSRHYDIENSVWGMSSSTDGDYGILSTTDGAGDAGNVSILVNKSLRMINSSITAAAGENATGNAGEILVSAGSIFMDPSYISSNSLSNNSGSNAGNVSVTATQGNLDLLESGIMTSAKKGNGGNINVAVVKTITMRNALITTSVYDSSGVGRGGDIKVNADTLNMQTGFVQANTVAQNAAGGDVAIDINNLLISANTLFRSPRSGYDFVLGIFGYNVIQSSSASGQSGNVTISVIPFDNLTALTDLIGSFLDVKDIGRDYCSIGNSSSLTLLGKGGLRDDYNDYIQIDSLGN